jgi:hypothetical protein
VQKCRALRQAVTFFVFGAPGVDTRGDVGRGENEVNKVERTIKMPLRGEAKAFEEAICEISILSTVLGAPGRGTFWTKPNSSTKALEAQNFVDYISTVLHYCTSNVTRGRDCATRSQKVLM